MRQNWSDRPVEFKYPEAHVAVLALSPFTSEQQSIRSAEARGVTMVSLSQALNSSTYLGISFTKLGGQYLDPVKSLVSNARAAVDGAGATGRPPVALRWRGLNSATAAGSTQT